ncbi:MAG: TadE/TadG family type IV pilus assembly protein [Solirubrobacterales bacterium]
MRNEKGQAAVEFALVLPFLILLICGVIDFGRILYTANTLTGACERAARYASINPTKTDTDVRDYIYSILPAGFDTTNINDVNADPDPTRTSNTTVTVTFTYEMDYVTPFIKNLLSSDFKTLSFSSACRVE